MKITPYARVGRSPLIKAVGLQKNFKEVFYTETLELDRYASADSDKGETMLRQLPVCAV